MNASKNDPAHQTLPALPTLVLDQQGLSVDPSTGPRSPQPWFVHWTSYAGVACYSASHQFIGRRDGSHPIATVDVILPDVMIGSEDEIRQDTRAAVERHAAKHLGPA